MTFAWNEEPQDFWQLMQWQRTLVNGCAVTEYFTVPQRQDPCRVAGHTPEEVFSSKDVIDMKFNDLGMRRRTST
jgi:hypothetical protein